jgi:hypothetical protein
LYSTASLIAGGEQGGKRCREMCAGIEEDPARQSGRKKRIVGPLRAVAGEGERQLHVIPMVAGIAEKHWRLAEQFGKREGVGHEEKLQQRGEGDRAIVNAAFPVRAGVARRHAREATHRRMCSARMPQAGVLATGWWELAWLDGFMRRSAFAMSRWWLARPGDGQL